jgi:RNA polymerase sigma factor (sigma-70 family)
MASRTNGAVLGSIRTLFRAGSFAGLTDRQLLECFADRRDEVAEAAFETLVARHGPMVFSVCRRLLGNRQDAEDAFQAAFLVLVRKARSIRIDDSLGGWLYAVSHRVAVRARAQMMSRDKALRTGVEYVPSPVVDDDDRFDIRPILHEEIRRLPDKYRAPIVLCYLEEMTHEQAASQLQWPLGTVRGRLARARDLLRSRLRRRGLGFGASAIGAVLASEASAAMPPNLARTTIQGAMNIAAGGTAAGIVPAASTTLTTGVLRTMFLSKFSIVATGVITAGVISTGAGLFVKARSATLATQETVAAASPARGNTDSEVETLRNALDQPITLNATDETLKNVLATISKQSNVTFMVDPLAQEDGERSLSARVSVKVTDVPVADALDLALNSLGLTYTLVPQVNGLLIAAPKDRDLAAMLARLRNLNAKMEKYRANRSDASAPALEEMESNALLLREAIARKRRAQLLDRFATAERALADANVRRTDEKNAVEAAAALLKQARLSSANDSRLTAEERPAAAALLEAAQRANNNDPRVVANSDPEVASLVEKAQRAIGHDGQEEGPSEAAAALLEKAQSVTANKAQAAANLAEANFVPDATQELANEARRNAGGSQNRSTETLARALNLATQDEAAKAQNQQANPGANAGGLSTYAEQKSEGSEASLYLAKTRKEIERMLTLSIKRCVELYGRKASVQKEVRAFEEVQMALNQAKVAGQADLGFPVEDPPAARSDDASVDEYLVKTRKEIEGSLTKLKKEAAAIEVQIKRSEAEAQRLARIHAPLAGGPDASAKWLKGLVTSVRNTLLPSTSIVTQQYTIARPVYESSTRQIHKPSAAEKDANRLLELLVPVTKPVEDQRK